MDIGQYIKNIIKEEGRTNEWMAEKLGINYKTFVGKLNRDSISASELFKISLLLDINLEKMKKELNYDNFLMNSRNFVYVPINCTKENIFKKDKLEVIKMEVVEQKDSDKYVFSNVVLDFNSIDEVKNNDNINVYAFREFNDYSEYKLEEINIHNLRHVYEEDLDEYKTTLEMIKYDYDDRIYFLKIKKEFSNIKYSPEHINKIKNTRIMRRIGAMENNKNRRDRKYREGNGFKTPPISQFCVSSK